MDDLKKNEFDWLVYADATFAGLSVLIPIPIIDSIFEGFFRRRMVGAIARRRQVSLSQETVAGLNRVGCSPAGCLIWPFKQLLSLLKKISRKILYFLTIKEATDQLSYYWHRAYLLDHLIQTELLTDKSDVNIVRAAVEQTLDATPTGPLNQLATQIIGNTHHAFRSLWRVIRRQPADQNIEDHRTMMGRRWTEYEDYLEKFVERFDQTLQLVIVEAEAAAALAAQNSTPPDTPNA